MTAGLSTMDLYIILIVLLIAVVIFVGVLACYIYHRKHAGAQQGNDVGRCAIQLQILLKHSNNPIKTSVQFDLCVRVILKPQSFAFVNILSLTTLSGCLMWCQDKVFQWSGSMRRPTLSCRRPTTSTTTRSCSTTCTTGTVSTSTSFWGRATRWRNPPPIGQPWPQPMFSQSFQLDPRGNLRFH